MADWTFNEARENLGISEAHLRNLIRKRLIPCYWVGDVVRFQPQRIEAWKAAGGTRPATGPENNRDAQSSAPDTRRRPPSGAQREVGSSQAWLGLVRDARPPKED